MKTIAALLLLSLSPQGGLGFANPVNVKSTASRPLFLDQSSQTSLEEDKGIVNTPIVGLSSSSLAGFITGITGFIGQGIAADDYELAELPPPYIPAIFGIVLVAGIGVLTSSLGNVMDEGKISILDN